MTSTWNVYKLQCYDDSWKRWSNAHGNDAVRKMQKNVRILQATYSKTFNSNM